MRRTAGQSVFRRLGLAGTSIRQAMYIENVDFGRSEELINEKT